MRTLDNEYRVIVGNIGTVHTGHNRRNAITAWCYYKLASKEGSGRCAGETVMLMRGDAILREYTPEPVFPSISTLARLVRAVRGDIEDDYRATDDPDDDTPGVCLTVGADGNGADSWSYQTGDNSFAGGAYGYPHWAVVSVYRDDDSRKLARDILGQLADLWYGAHA